MSTSATTDPIQSGLVSATFSPAALGNFRATLHVGSDDGDGYAEVNAYGATEDCIDDDPWTYPGATDRRTGRKPPTAGR